MFVSMKREFVSFLCILMNKWLSDIVGASEETQVLFLMWFKFPQIFILVRNIFILHHAVLP